MRRQTFDTDLIKWDAGAPFVCNFHETRGRAHPAFGAQNIIGPKAARAAEKRALYWLVLTLATTARPCGSRHAHRARPARPYHRRARHRGAAGPRPARMPSAAKVPTAPRARARL